MNNKKRWVKLFTAPYSAEDLTLKINDFLAYNSFVQIIDISICQTHNGSFVATVILEQV